MRDWPVFFQKLSQAAGFACVLFFGGLWLLSGRAEFLGSAGGLWALAQVFAGVAAFAGRRGEVPPPDR